MKFRFAAAFAIAALTTAPAFAQFMSISSIISGIGGAEFYRDAERADSASGLRVVRLSTLAGAERSAARLYATVDRKQRAVHYLQSNLVINPMAMAAIRGEGVSLDQIVSLDVAGDGGGVLYANDL
jgi:hypothetical protein